jgi:hypothetical protein
MGNKFSIVFLLLFLGLSLQWVSAQSWHLAIRLNPCRTATLTEQGELYSLDEDGKLYMFDTAMIELKKASVIDFYNEIPCLIDAKNSFDILVFYKTVQKYRYLRPDLSPMAAIELKSQTLTYENICSGKGGNVIVYDEIENQIQAFDANRNAVEAPFALGSLLDGADGELSIMMLRGNWLMLGSAAGFVVIDYQNKTNARKILNEDIKGITADKDYIFVFNDNTVWQFSHQLKLLRQFNPPVMQAKLKAVWQHKFKTRAYLSNGDVYESE